MCVAVPTDDGRNSCVFDGAGTTKSTRKIFFTKNIKAIIVVCADPFSLCPARLQSGICQWCALVRCSPFCLTFLFVPFAPRHHRTGHHGISTHYILVLPAFFCRLAGGSQKKRKAVVRKESADTREDESCQLKDVDRNPNTDETRQCRREGSKFYDIASVMVKRPRRAAHGQPLQQILQIEARREGAEGKRQALE